MRKIYLTCAIAALALSVNAQSSTDGGSKFRGKLVKSNVRKHVPAAVGARATNEFYLDYEYADQMRQDFEMGITDWQRYIWDMNMRYTTADSFSQRYAVVDFYDGTVNQVVDAYGITDGSAYPVAYNYTTPLTIDSVFVNCGHSNSSGLNDTLTINIIQLTSAGYPTSTVLFSKSVISNTTFNAGSTSWLQGGVVGEAIGYAVPVGTRFGVEIKYYGAHSDTFGILAGFANNGSSCAATPTLPFFAVSSFYQNSYRIDIQYESYGLLPTSTGADTYYECDGTGGFSAGNDSENALQNWAVWAKVTNITGVADEAQLISSLEQNVPNPFSANATINYTLAKASDVTFTVTDLSGKVILSQNYGKQSAGSQKITVDGANLANGIYYYTLTAGSSKATRKMVVSK